MAINIAAVSSVPNGYSVLFNDAEFLDSTGEYAIEAWLYRGDFIKDPTSIKFIDSFTNLDELNAILEEMQ